MTSISVTYIPDLKPDNKKTHSALGGSDRPALPVGSLPGVQSQLILLGNIRALLDDLIGFGEDKLNVAWVRHVRINLDDRVSYQCSARASSLSLSGNHIRDHGHDMSFVVVWEPG